MNKAKGETSKDKKKVEEQKESEQEAGQIQESPAAMDFADGSQQQ